MASPAERVAEALVPERAGHEVRVGNGRTKKRGEIKSREGIRLAPKKKKKKLQTSTSLSIHQLHCALAQGFSPSVLQEYVDALACRREAATARAYSALASAAGAGEGEGDDGERKRSRK